MTTFDDRDVALQRLLASGLSYLEAGAKLGLSQATVYRAMRSPRFRQSVDAERSVQVDRVVSAIGSAAEEAVEVLHEAAMDGAAPLQVRVRAASDLLNQLRSWQGVQRTSPPLTMEEVEQDALDRITGGPMRADSGVLDDD